MSLFADLEEGEGLAGDTVTDAPPTPDLHRPDASSKSIPTQYGRVQDSGAPAPLAPRLITFSLLPKSQWQNLVHLEAIKVVHLDHTDMTALHLGSRVENAQCPVTSASTPLHFHCHTCCLYI